MKPAYIIAGLRTAVVPQGGAFAALNIHDLAAPVIGDCLANAGLGPAQVNELILSNALGGGGNPARLTALAAGLPETVAGLSIDRQCVGGLDAVLLAARLVQSGAADVVIAGGAESASRRPIRLRTHPDGSEPSAYDRPPFTPWPDRDPDMHQAADDLAQHLSISRADQDNWAIKSHAKALAADLTPELVSLSSAPVTHDVFTRRLSAQLCARTTAINGTITAANAAVSADAAAFVVVVSEEIAKRTPQKAIRILGGTTLGSDPVLPGLAPVRAIRSALSDAGLCTDQLGCTEVMEAYAVQAIACVQGADLNPETTNKGGGALARGHPIGASGAILAVRLYHEMLNSRRPGLATIAAAGGLGTALLLSWD